MTATQTNIEPQLEFTSVEAKAGFRLHKLEVYNWGTFHNKIWSLDLGGDNALLTGDIGSGKSTLVDAVTTLLVPSQKIVYNKAAGAEKSERSLRTYVMGFYKAARGDSSLSARPVALRDQNSYSVILGLFFNESFGQYVTLAQLFWMKGEGQPARLFIVAEGLLSIAEHFSGFGSDIQDLKKRLRKLKNVQDFDSFPPYAADFRRRFGIDNEQALDLFNQTVSMKSVGNLTDFVRHHMLEPFIVEPRILALIGHFDDLHRAHEAVLKSKIQIDLLIPLVADCSRHAQISAGVIDLKGCREGLRAWFAAIKGELLAKRLQHLKIEGSRLDTRIATLMENRRDMQGKRDELKRSIADNGGDRLERIKSEISSKESLKDERYRKAEKYNALALATGFAAASNGDVFTVNRAALEAVSQATEERQAEVQNECNEIGFELRKLKEIYDQVRLEIESLRNRRSNIRSRELTMRANLCQALGLEEKEIPFAGELIQVREGEGEWEGAIERVLHGFALSLLIPESHYAKVAQWVDRTHLNNRLVYFRIREQKSSSRVSGAVNSLVDKLALKSDSRFYGWLESEMNRRFDYACCDTLDQFRREPKAIMPSGQIKTSGERHEKDDRTHIADRSHYVLGWSNEAKLAVLEKQAKDLQIGMEALASKNSVLFDEQKVMKTRMEKLQQLVVFESFQDLDWKPVAVEVERLEREKQELELASDILRTLSAQLKELEKSLEAVQKELDSANGSLGENRGKQSSAIEAEKESVARLAAFPSDRQAQVFPRLEILSQELMGQTSFTVESCDNREKDFRESLQNRIDGEEQKRSRLNEKIVSSMIDYRNAYPLETQEVDARAESAGEFSAMLTRLQSDDLPRHEEKFKKLLNENTIREVANFQSQLHRERQSIKERIELINKSLEGIDYNHGTYIRLEAVPTTDADIRDFQQDLRACTDGTLTGSDEETYSEAKFLQVKHIIGRFRGREGSTELDMRWRERTTDVRNWFVFSASERWRENNVEREHYSDSGGKSGGQKEKLAYTILAASLAYQFGLESGVSRARSFRFVVIDEAFGRGSDESARFGLELFKSLNLQLLIVTPLQKIHIIEPHVSSVGFVHNEDGKISFLRNLTIEEYRNERDERDKRNTRKA